MTDKQLRDEAMTLFLAATTPPRTPQPPRGPITYAGGTGA